jgi:ferredoxin--NADP+ reductase
VIDPPLPGAAAARRRALRTTRTHRVIERRDLSSGVFVLRFTREGLRFSPGQWINVGPGGRREQREYSVYSSPREEFLEILVKEIPDGSVSPVLRRIRPGDTVEVEGPHGSFTLVEGAREAPRFLFCATGTGVSPFHCFAQNRPGLDYLVLHGVRDREDFTETGVFDSRRYMPCVSRGPAGTGAYQGRLTALLKEKTVDPSIPSMGPLAPRVGSSTPLVESSTPLVDSSTYCYLCGNSDMIYEVYGILRDRGVPREQIFAEVYF